MRLLNTIVFPDGVTVLPGSLQVGRSVRVCGTPPTVTKDAR